MGVFDKIDMHVKSLDEEVNCIAINCFLAWWVKSDKNQNNFFKQQVFEKGNVIITSSRYQRQRPEIGIVLRTTPKKIVIQIEPMKIGNIPALKDSTECVDYCTRWVFKDSALKISNNIQEFCELIGLNISDIVNSL